MLTYVWAYLAGLLTLINPCVLPLLPIVLAAAFQASRRGPLALAGGLAISFTIIGVGVTAFGHSIGVDSYVINRSAAILMIVFGMALLIPQTQTILATLAAPMADSANTGINRIGDAGLLGQFGVGVLLGAVWSPCIGPTLGGAVSLAATGESLGHATFTMVMFGIGVSTVLLALAYGSRTVVSTRREKLKRMMPWAKPVMGAMLLLVGTFIWFGIDKAIEAWLLDVMPIWLQDLSVSV